MTDGFNEAPARWPGKSDAYDDRAQLYRELQ